MDNGWLAGERVLLCSCAHVGKAIIIMGLPYPSIWLFFRVKEKEKESVQAR